MKSFIGIKIKCTPDQYDELQPYIKSFYRDSKKIHEEFGIEISTSIDMTTTTCEEK